MAPTDDEGAKLVEEVFSDVAIRLVAKLDKPSGTAEFISQISESSFNQENWQVWRRGSAFGENTLATISGNEAYLIKVDGSVSLNLAIVGRVTFFNPAWRPDQYNLLNFSLKNAVSFADFWSPAGAKHPVNKMFRLEADGDWVGVQGADLMQPGEAYWVFSEGASDYTGPVKVRFRNQSPDGIDFGSTVDEATYLNANNDTISVSTEELFLTNLSGSPQAAQLVRVPAASFGDEFQLYDLNPNPTGDPPGMSLGGLVSDLSIGPIAAEATEYVTLGAFRNWNTGSRRRSNLYRLEFAHHYFWLPMAAGIAGVGNDAVQSVETQHQGLWVGDVVLDQVSVIEAGGANPTPRNTAGVNSMRLIVHVDAGGQARLLSSVMIMQREAAAEEFAPEVVLVVDESKIPSFEGIQQRGDVKVGQRIDTIAYDMPRVGTNTVYELSWPLSGGLGANNVLTTTAPLVLDPTHRSNPFRHAFHRDHTAGPTISRSMTFTFAETQQAGRMTGQYEEIITGLAAQAITTRGSIQLERITDAGSLE